MYKVSVIIPVYNVARYIEKCARSLFEQTLDEVEYLFIDDCSTDNSLAVLENVIKDYPEREQHVVVHKMGSNSGQAVVRKWGIEHAKGEYIIHCDSDDWVEKEAYGVLYEYAIENKLQVVFFDYFSVDDNKSSVVRLIGENCLKTRLLSGLIAGSIKGSLCFTLVSRSLYNNVRFLFPTGDMTEDITMIVQLLSLTETYGYLQQPLYYYLQRQDSISHGSSTERCMKRYNDCKSNMATIMSFLEDEASTTFKDEINARKLATINQLLPAVYRFRYFILWHRTYKGMLRNILANKMIDKSNKIKFIITYVGLYPIYHLCKGYQFAR